MPPHYVFLFFAVLAETVGTTALHATQQFTRLWPSVICILSYAAAFYLLSHAMKVIPIGVLYAMWSGLGIVFIAIIGFAVLGQRLDTAAVIGIALIMAGILTINLFSGTTTH